MQPPLVAVILPTYREEGTIGSTLDGVQAALDAAGITWEAVVVDDDSPDGTHAAVRQAAGRHGDRVRLVVRRNERGLASAVVRGFQEARGELLVVMDADGQHPPGAVVAMVRAAVDESADVVVGSRHVRGGSVGGFGALRRFVSWGAATMARIALPRVRKGRVTDPMSGLFLVRKSAVDGVALDPVGYKILLEVLAKARPRRGRRLVVREVPYRFGERTAGESKLGAGVMFDFVRHLVRLGLADRENRRLLEFLIVGGSGIVVNLGLLWAGGHFFAATAGVRLLVSAAIAREGAVVWNFLLNDVFTFRDVRGHTGRNMLVRFLQFNLVSLFAFGAYLAVLFVLERLGMHYLLAGFLAILVSVFFNFKGNVEWTYRHHEDRRGRGESGAREERV